MNSNQEPTATQRFRNWALTQSLAIFHAGPGCCADEFYQTWGCRYDLERFGLHVVNDPAEADLLIISTAITHKSAPDLKTLYDRMLEPRFVLSIGSCANCGGYFGQEESYSVVRGIDKIIPVDVFVAGCPPRPEAIIHGLLTLQEKILGTRRT